MQKPVLKTIAFFIFLGVLSTDFLGCAKNYYFETADEVMAKTTVTRNRITNVTTVTGPYAETSAKNAMYLLTAQYTDNTMTSCQLVIYQTRTRVKGPAYYYEAFDPDGNKMPFSRFTDTFSDSDEKVGIIILQEKLQASRDKGMEFILYGKRDELSLQVEPFYIQGFLAKAKGSG